MASFALVERGSSGSPRSSQMRSTGQTAGALVRQILGRHGLTSALPLGRSSATRHRTVEPHRTTLSHLWQSELLTQQPLSMCHRAAAPWDGSRTRTTGGLPSTTQRHPLPAVAVQLDGQRPTPDHARVDHYRANRSATAMALRLETSSHPHRPARAALLRVAQRTNAKVDTALAPVLVLAERGTDRSAASMLGTTDARQRRVHTTSTAARTPLPERRLHTSCVWCRWCQEASPQRMM